MKLDFLKRETPIMIAYLRLGKGSESGLKQSTFLAFDMLDGRCLSVVRLQIFET